MSYAQGTTHYNLPQTQGDDKRDWFDTNQAFNDVDSTLFAAAEGVQTLDKDLSTVKSELSEAQKDIDDIQVHDAEVDIKVSALETLTAQHSVEITEVAQDCEDMVCAIEEGSATAKYNHEVGSYFRYNNTLYIATAKIAINDTIVPNVNCKTTDIVSELSGDDSIVKRVDDLEGEVSTIDTSLAKVADKVGEVDIADYGATVTGAIANSKVKYDGEKMLVLNDGVWSEYKSGSAMDTYSTEEQAIGTWIDGKTIYRRVFVDTSFDTNNTHLDNSIIPNIAEVVKLYGTTYGTDTTGSHTFPLPYCYGDSVANWAFLIRYDFDNGIRRQAGTRAFGSDRTYNTRNVYVIEYTKNS